MIINDLSKIKQISKVNQQVDKVIKFIQEYPFRDGEIFREIKTYEANERYFINNIGDTVISICGNKWNKLILAKDKDGYLCFTIHYRDTQGKKRKKRCYVHRVVAQHFVPNDKPEEKTVVHHKDGNIYNNNYQNLVWMTKVEHDKLPKKKKIIDV